MDCVAKVNIGFANRVPTDLESTEDIPLLRLNSSALLQSLSKGNLSMKADKNWPKLATAIMKNPGDFSDWYLETIIAVAQAELRRRSSKRK